MANIAKEISTKSGPRSSQLPGQLFISNDIQEMVGMVYDWLLCADFSATRRFFLGIISRINDLKLLQQIVYALSAVKQKDFIYSRSQCNSSLLVEHKILSSNQRKITKKHIENVMSKTWEWFEKLSLRNKASFVFSIAHAVDDSSILYQAVNLAKTIFIQHSKKQEDVSVLSEDSSLPSTDYSFHTNQHPNIYILASVNAQFEALQKPSEIDTDYSQDKFDELSICNDHLSSVSSLDPQAVVEAHSKQALCGVSRFADFVSKLPVHLSKKIIGLLDVHSQSNAALVNTSWHGIVRQVQFELRIQREIVEEAVLMQGVSAKGAHPNYAKKKLMPVPIFSDDSQKRVSMEQLKPDPFLKKKENNIPIIPGVTIAQYEMEERNVYCGSYNVLILDKKPDRYRVMHYGGGNVVASGSSNRMIRLFDVNTGRELLPSIRGHPGSIKSLFVADTDRKYVFSGSYDTTIRRWHVGSSGCHQIMHGHKKSIITLDYSNGILVSGSKDGLVKIWNIQNGKNVCSFRHAKSAFVTSVKIQENLIVSSCDRGVIKLWDLNSRKLLKTLLGHTSAVAQVSMDRHYIVSASHDEYVFAWVKEGNICHPVKSYRHPKAVLCVELCYLRIISGCVDGKIRVLHLHTGECLRVIRGNSKCEPVLSLCATANRLVVNLESNLLLLQFEHLELNYDVKYDEVVETETEELNGPDKRPSFSARSSSYVRAFRNRAASVTCSNIRSRPLSAPVKRPLSLQAPKRPVSSLPSLALVKSISRVPSAAPSRPKSGSLGDTSSFAGKKSSRDAFNIHNSRAMSIISGVSSIIVDEENMLDDIFYRRPSTGQSSRSRTRTNPSRQSKNPLSRERLHMRISSIQHNMQNGIEDINTALNGAHPDVREVYHSYMNSST